MVTIWVSHLAGCICDHQASNGQSWSCRREPGEGIIQAAAKAKGRPLRWSVCAGCVLGYSASCTRLKECFSPSHLDAVPSFNRYLLAVCQGLGSSA